MAARSVSEAIACACAGLAGDMHADPLSPRQILLAGAPAYARHGLDPRALDENLLLDIDTAALPSGALLQVGPQAVLWLSFQCEPCGHLDGRQRGLARRIGKDRGMLARVLTGGTITVGDTVALLDAAPPWSAPTVDDWRRRVARVLDAVPDGFVVDYRQLARLAGVAPGYCRVFPRIARELGLAHKAVAASAPSERPRWAGGGYFA